ncbi:MAG: glycosyltransferase [Chloroflexi bacterium]|nr:glycosyltransferase [Chloroflexota bacterium]
MPKVSVVIPTYNRAQLIRETLRSVLAQTYHDFEVVVIDDGSTDNTQEALVAYGSQIRYFRKDNGGQASARNLGIRVASGEYIAFLDSDDLWLPSKLEEQVTTLVTARTKWVYCDAELFDGATGRTVGLYSRQNNRPYEGHVARQLLLNDFIASPTPIIHREVFDRVGYFDESALLRSREDWEMWLRIAPHYSVAYLAKPLARYRLHSGSVTRGQDILTWYESEIAVIRQVMGYAPNVYAGLSCDATAAVCIAAGRGLAGQGRIDEARWMFSRAIHNRPFKPHAYLFWFATLLGWKFLSALIKLNRSRRRLLGSRVT